MRLRKFQIQNYKSIKTFEPCWVEGITILAGKNESGKTAVLEALRDFDTSVEEIPQSAYPLEDDATPETLLSLWFDPTPMQLSELAKNSGINFDAATQEYIKKNGLNVIKETSGHYYIGDGLVEVLDKSTELQKKKIIKEVAGQLEKLRKLDARLDAITPIADESTMKLSVSSIDKAMVVVEGQTEFSEDAQKLVQEIKGAVKSINAITNYDTIITAIKLPRFVLFDGFGGKLPDQVPLSDVESHPAVMDFIEVAGIDINKVRTTTDEQRRTNLLNKKSAVISGDFKGYWHQDSIELAAKVSNEQLVIYVKEGDKTTVFKPEQRSKGFQWFLSFYLRLKAENVEDEAAVILIDEPDQHLHASAQQDILDVLENIAAKSQIIFSTHSPYLLDPAKLGRVRPVTKDLRQKGEGTVISNKIHKDADTDTLKPIITALGLDITKDTRLVRENNVVLEGMSDYYYLHAMALLLTPKLLTNTSLLPSVGASQAHLLASVLTGWNLGFIVVLDNDKEGKKAEKVLKEDLMLSPEKIIKVSDKDGLAIEDLFSAGDFKKYVMGEDAPTTADKSNSELVKNADKILKAKSFLEKVHSQKAVITLTDTTKNNFLALFKKMQEGLGISSSVEDKIVVGERAATVAAVAAVAAATAVEKKG